MRPGRAPEPAAPRPLTIRLAQGDIADAQASLIVVSHLTGLAPAGAAAAIDTVLGGAISRRAPLLRGRFGTPWFLPTLTSPLAAGGVVVILLGEPEHFNPQRLPETGMAIVDAAELVSVRDAATVLHGAGWLRVSAEVAAERMIDGVLTGLTRDPATPLRELTIVEQDADKLDAIRTGLDRAVAGLDPRSGITVFVERQPITPRRRPLDRRETPAGIPYHLRLGITKSGSKLKVTSTGAGSFSPVSEIDFPARLAESILGDLESVLNEQAADPATAGMGEATARWLESIGMRLQNGFVNGGLQVAQQLIDAPGKQVVLALSKETVGLPWELLNVDGDYLALTHSVGRQVELPFLGRQSAHTEPRQGLQVLVVGDPDGTLPAARDEAKRVASVLYLNKRATVTQLIYDEESGRPVTFAHVSRALDTTDFDVLHFAGHGSYDPLREGDSGLQLADRVLTADDLAVRRWVPRLIVANACHSADTGPGQPFDGGQATRDMVQQLLVTGTRTFIGATWKIGDKAAALFAEELYRALLGSTTERPTTVGEAVRRARQLLFDRLGPGDPTWAAYALYGSPWSYVL